MSAYGVQDIFDLAELGAAMYRQRLRREQPGIDESQLDELVGEWLRSRPGAPHGDAVGRSANRFRDPV